MSATAITLVCDPAAPAISDALADRALEALGALGAVERATLREGVAEDYVLASSVTRAEVEALIAPALSGAAVDVIVQPARTRRKRLLIADMDSTIIGQECIDELADFADLKAEIAAITERAMRGELDFEAALDERVGKLKGLPESALEECLRARIHLNPGARTLVATMNARGALTVLVSGGFTYFVARIASRAGFQHARANELVIANGRLTGVVRRPILGRQAKREALIHFRTIGALQPEETLAVGDGANDLDMIAAAGLGVAFHAKPKVAEAADVAIRYADLTALLYAQGIPAAEFTT